MSKRKSALKNSVSSVFCTANVTGFGASVYSGVVLGVAFALSMSVVIATSAQAQTSSANVRPMLGEARSSLNSAQSRVFSVLAEEAQALHPALIKQLFPVDGAASAQDAKLLWSVGKSELIGNSLSRLQQELAESSLSKAQREAILKRFVQQNPWFPRFLEFSSVKATLSSQASVAARPGLSSVPSATAAKFAKSISAFAIFAMLVDVASAGESAGLAGAADTSRAENIEHREAVPFASASRRTAPNRTSN